MKTTTALRGQFIKNRLKSFFPTWLFCFALLWAAPSARAIVIQYQFVPTSGDLAATGVLYLPSPGLSQAGVTPLTGSFFDPHYLNSQGQPIGQFLLDTLFTTGIGGVDGFELSGGGFRLRMNSGGDQGWALQVQQGPFFLDLPGESGAGNWVVASSVPDGGATATMLAFSLVAVAAVARQKLQSKSTTK